eukprot:scaffold7317_cov114-Cylindrotheca_fusiformis.AAC.3
MEDAALADFMEIMAPGHHSSFSSGRFLAAPRPETFATDRLFNKEPPSATATFIIGGILWLVSFGMWYQRVQKLKERKQGDLEGSDLLRGMIACAIDNDSPYYTIVSYSAVSMIFLGGIQLDYRNTFIAMICYYAIVSCGDSLRVLLAFYKYRSLSDVFIFSEMDAGLKDKHKEDLEEKDRKFETMEVSPSNIYEDMGRERTIVFMIFATQVIFVVFVCLDVYRADVVRCIDGTPDCPVGGTLGSYGFYIMGIFQACVYLLGPKTNFGQSEQNPGFWLIILLASKRSGARLLWENPIKDPRFSKNTGTLKDTNGNVILGVDGKPKLYHARDLKKNDLHMWTRFLMSYLVNGVGFHVLVHALPIQVAAQSSFTGVVFRAVGMLYLVDLDDTKGFNLIITDKEDDEEEPETESDGNKPEQQGNPSDEEEHRPSGPQSPLRIDATGIVAPIQEEATSKIEEEKVIAAQAQSIVEEAESRLQHLRKYGPYSMADLGKQYESSRMKIDTHKTLSVMGFGSMAVNNGGGVSTSIDSDNKKKKNTGQAAILQASIDGENGGGLPGQQEHGGGGMGDTAVDAGGGM